MHRLVPCLLVLAACAPNNATLVEGSYITFLSDGSSLSLVKDEVPYEKYKTHYTVDCREFADGEADLQLPDALDICNKKKDWPPVYETWATYGGYWVVSEPLEPWRGEALITSEGDLQIAFHHRIPNGQDMRFVISIDPDFAPQHCVQDASGTTMREPLDGDWIENWSTETLGWVADNADKYGDALTDIDQYNDGKLYFLNALSYQYNPLDTTQPAWNLPEEWEAGAAQAKFVEEPMIERRTRYGDPRVYNAIEASGSTETQYYGIDPADLFWCDLEPGSNPKTDECTNNRDHTSLTEIDDDVHAIAKDIHNELNVLMTPDVGSDQPVFDYMPLVHSNFWREPDGYPAGLDGWSELHYNYVVFDKSSDLTVGGSAEGAFGLVFDAAESASRMFVKGRFKIDKIKKDHWTTQDLELVKLVENGSTLCSAASPGDADPSKDNDK
jgi:hypothetical protein